MKVNVLNLKVYCCVYTLDCYSGPGPGRNYTGTQSFSKSGTPCQRWDAQTPHPHDGDTTDVSRFPSGNLSEASNYCRNPDDSDGPWCYTIDNDNRWELCDLEKCGELEKHTAYRERKHMLVV